MSQEPPDDATYTLVMEASEAGKLYYLDVLLVGAGAAGIGVAHALLRGGLAPSKLLIIDKGPCVGSSFRQWHPTTQFISPSWPGYPFGIQDLNAVVPDTSVNAANGSSQHPTGNEYAAYLERMVEGANLPFMFNNAVTSIERVKEGCFLVQTEQAAVIIANYVVWCGGEWNSPRILPSNNKNFFAEDATVHYKNANLEELLNSRRSPDDPIILVGGGEAGADLGVAFAQKGAKVLIVEQEESSNDDGETVDPSRQLSPITQERLARVADQIEFRSGTKCRGVQRKGDTVTVELEATADQTVSKVTTGANVVMCTGFDHSSNPLLKNLFRLRENGSLEVNPEHDESTITRNLFLAGPALVHRVTCDDKDDESSKNVDNNNDEDQDIIFCFVYKYRTRFAVVASEIIERYVEDQRLINQDNNNNGESENSAVSAEELDEIIVKCEQMQNYYRSKGMMLTDLSCAQLACGMSANDTPTYDYDPCAGCQPDCATC